MTAETRRRSMRYSGIFMGPIEISNRVRICGMEIPHTVKRLSERSQSRQVPPHQGTNYTVSASSREKRSVRRSKFNSTWMYISLQVPTRGKYRSFFVPNRDRIFLICVEYGKLKAVSCRRSYQFSSMDECIYSLGDAQVLSKLDTNSGY